MKSLLSTAASPLARPLAKDRISVYNGVAVRDTPLFDGSDHEPEYKTGLCNAITTEVQSGDRVVVVGGGRGVAATYAARQGGRVMVYEAAEEMVALLEETQRLNNVAFGVNHGVVGQPHDVYGSLGDADHIRPSTLNGDVLVLDCEGAELDILPTDGFETVIVETHPQHSAPTDRVLECLDNPEIVASDPVAGDVVVA